MAGGVWTDSRKKRKDITRGDRKQQEPREERGGSREHVQFKYLRDVMFKKLRNACPMKL